MTAEMLNGVIKIQFMDMPDACAASVSLPRELIDAEPEVSVSVLLTSAAAMSRVSWTRGWRAGRWRIGRNWSVCSCPRSMRVPSGF